MRFCADCLLCTRAITQHSFGGADFFRIVLGRTPKSMRTVCVVAPTRSIVRRTPTPSREARRMCVSGPREDGCRRCAPPCSPSSVTLRPGGPIPVPQRRALWRCAVQTAAPGGRGMWLHRVPRCPGAQADLWSLGLIMLEYVLGDACPWQDPVDDPRPGASDPETSGEAKAAEGPSRPRTASLADRGGAKAPDGPTIWPPAVPRKVVPCATAVPWAGGGADMVPSPGGQGWIHK